MPAQLVAGTVAVFSYPGTQAFDLFDQRIPTEIRKVFVHGFLN